MNLTTLQYKIFVAVAFIAEILSVPLAFVLPIELSFENGLIENAQIIILIIGTIWILSVRSPLKWFKIFSSAGFLLIVFRELSWGRVFFPVDMEKLGPVYVFLTVYILAMIFILIRFVPIKEIFLSRQPLAAFAVMIVALILVSVGDQGWLVGKAHGQILEELNELIFYATLPVAALYYCRVEAEKILR